MGFSPQSVSLPNEHISEHLENRAHVRIVPIATWTYPIRRVVERLSVRGRNLWAGSWFNLEQLRMGRDFRTVL